MGNQESRAGARSNSDTTSAIGSADASKAPVHPRTFIVPRRPGSLREYQARSQRPRDELDDLIDELLGPTTDEQPGRFDAGLAVAGLSLVAWAFLLGGPSVALWIGIAAMLLGLALPVRAAFRLFDSSPSGGPRGRIVDLGLPLDASHPATLALIGAHARLMQASCKQGKECPNQTVSAGHEAVVEVARRLAGQPPDTPEEVRLVSMWTDALEALTHRVLRSDDRGLPQAAIPTQGRNRRTHATPRPIPIERRWMSRRAQAGSPNPGNPATSPGRRP